MDNKEFDITALYSAYIKLLGLSEMVNSAQAAPDTVDLDKPVILSKEEYLQLIDLSLATGDKEWFIELAEKMESVAF